MAEARYKASEVQPDWRTVIGHPEVSYTVSELLFVIELFWYDPALPEQVRNTAMKIAARITNYQPPVAGVYRR